MSSFVGAPFKAAGHIIQGQQTAKMLNYQAGVMEKNASESRVSAAFNAERQQMVAAKVMGRASASYGGSGVTSDSGSVLQVMAASAANSELDRQNIIHGGEIRAVNYENQASMDRYSADSAVKASYFNALSDVMGGVGSAMENKDWTKDKVYDHPSVEGDGSGQYDSMEYDSGTDMRGMGDMGGGEMIA